ncbi:MAG: WXG100 family type VII secretion target [Carbonactinosporaceae bacterium]
MRDGFGVSPAVLRGAAGAARTIAGDARPAVTRSLDAAAATAASGVVGSMSATAADAFADEWDVSLEQLVASLERYGEQLDQAALSYDTSEVASRESFGRIDAALNPGLNPYAGGAG